MSVSYVVTPPRYMQIVYDNDAILIDLDLSRQRINEEVLEKYNVVAHQLFVLQADSEAYIRINRMDGPLIPIGTGDSFQFIEVKRLYVTNPPGTGRLKILLLYRREEYL